MKDVRKISAASQDAELQCWSSRSRDLPLLHGPLYQKVELRLDFTSETGNRYRLTRRKEAV